MKVVFDRSANGRGRMVHLGEALTVVLRWDGIMFGIEWDDYSVAVNIGPLMVICYAPSD